MQWEQCRARCSAACLDTSSRDCTEQVTPHPSPSLALSWSPHPIQWLGFCHLLVTVYHQLGHWFSSAAAKSALAPTVMYCGLLKQLAGISIHQPCPSSPSSSISSPLAPTPGGGGECSGARPQGCPREGSAMLCRAKSRTEWQSQHLE